MAAYRQTVRIQVCTRWWLRPYLYAVAYTSAVTGLEPGWEKVGRYIRRGLVARIVPDRVEVAA